MGRNNCSWKIGGNCSNPEAMYLGQKCPYKAGISCGHYEIIEGGDTMAATPSQPAYQGYCMKCKAKKNMAKASVVTMKNKRQAVKGTCVDCGTKMFKILGKGK